MKSLTLISTLLLALAFTACTKKAEKAQTQITEAVPATITPKDISPSEPVPAPSPQPIPPVAQKPAKVVRRDLPKQVAAIETTDSVDSEIAQAVDGTVPAPSTDVTSSEVMGPAGASTETVNANFERSLGANITVGHLSGLRDNVRSFTEVVGEIDYKVAPATRIGIGQSARKMYEIAQTGENEFLLDDTRLFLDHTLSKDFLSMEWDLNVGTTLPTSKRSADTRHITRPSLGLTVKKRLFSDAVCISYSPSVAYYFNQYGTDAAGNPLKRISLAQLAALEVKIFRKLGLNVWGRGYAYMYEEFSNSSLTPGTTNDFSYGSYLAYDINPTFGAQLGYVWGNSMLRNTQYEDNFYDPPTGRFYAAVEVRF